MIQPGRETNLPTSSGTVNGASGIYGTTVFKLDGFTLTLGCVLLLIVGMLTYQTFFARRRR